MLDKGDKSMMPKHGDSALAVWACLRLTSLQALHAGKRLLLSMPKVRAIAHNISSGSLSKAACEAALQGEVIQGPSRQEISIRDSVSIQ